MLDLVRGHRHADGRRRRGSAGPIRRRRSRRPPCARRRCASAAHAFAEGRRDGRPSLDHVRAARPASGHLVGPPEPAEERRRAAPADRPRPSAAEPSTPGRSEVHTRADRPPTGPRPPTTDDSARTPPTFASPISRSFGHLHRTSSPVASLGRLGPRRPREQREQPEVVGGKRGTQHERGHERAAREVQPRPAQPTASGRLMAGADDASTRAHRPRRARRRARSSTR